MTKRRSILVLLCLALALSGCKFRKDARVGKTAQVSAIQVIQGHEFDVILKDGERVHAFLPVATPPQAKEKVTKLLNKCLYPRVTFKARVDKGWTVDIEFCMSVCNGRSCFLREESLTAWLKSNGLAWE